MRQREHGLSDERELRGRRAVCMGEVKAETMEWGEGHTAGTPSPETGIKKMRGINDSLLMRMVVCVHVCVRAGSGQLRGACSCREQPAGGICVQTGLESPHILF